MEQRRNMHILVMGVSGSGKTTVSRALAEKLNLPMVEADDFHPENNIARMSSGIPLTDKDREPWLIAVRKELQKQENGCVLACSALKSSYREVLSQGIPHFFTVYLQGEYESILHRMKLRNDHFMPSSLLESQFEALEPPTDAIEINIADTLENQVNTILSRIKHHENKSMSKAEIGLIGLGVMGKALARNMADNGIKVAVFNVPLPGEESIVEEFVDSFSDSGFIPCKDLNHLAESLSTPRKVLLMIKSGDPVDQMIDQLQPILEEGDMIIDGGNSFYKDTESRISNCENLGLHFIGMGVSGGEMGALKGPSIMPSGNSECKDVLLPMFEKIAARADGHPCVRWIGSGGSGHFVKMIHNGIEYADMQLISETYALLKNEKGMNNEEIASVLSTWKTSMHNSYLLDITIKILTRKENGSFVLDEILDVAGHKGTGLWTSREALELGIPVPTIQSAMNQRIISSFKSLREKIGILKPFKIMGAEEDIIKSGILFCRLVALMEGLHMIIAANNKYQWGISLNDVLSVWRGGCIIRSDMLIPVKESLDNALLEHPLESVSFNKILADLYPAACGLRESLAKSHQSFPAMNAAIDHYRSLRTVYLPINMIQAQRDFFGAHTYKRLDDRENTYHTQWE